jgi:hypothetical protein
VVLYTRDDYDTATGAHAWTGGLFDGKVRLPVRNFRDAAREIESTLAHEMTHWYVREIAPKCPLWLNEGMAQLQEGRPPGTVTAGLIRAARRGDRYTSLTELPATWSKISDRDRVALYYAQSFHFTDYLVNRYGWRSLGDLLRALEKKPDILEAFEDVFRVGLAQVEQDWLAALR